MNRPAALAHLLPAFALLPFALAGCGGGGTNGTASTSSAPTPMPAPVLSASATLPDGLTATLAEDKSAISTGGSVTYTLTNSTSQPITYAAKGGPVGGSLQIVAPSGQTVLPPPSTGGSPGVPPPFTLP